MLTVSTLRSLLGAALGKEVGAFIDVLQARRMLPDDGTALTPRSVIVALLALISGEEPAAAASAGLRLTEYQLTLGGIARSAACRSACLDDLAATNTGRCGAWRPSRRDGALIGARAMRTTIETRLSRLEAVQPRETGRRYVFLEVAGQYDPDERLRERGIAPGPDDEVLWIELVGVAPPPRGDR